MGAGPDAGRGIATVALGSSAGDHRADGPFGGTSFISEALAEFLAHALDVPESRIRRAAGLPAVKDPREDIATGPHLRLVKDDD